MHHALRRGLKACHPLHQTPRPDAATAGCVFNLWLVACGRARTNNGVHKSEEIFMRLNRTRAATAIVTMALLSYSGCNIEVKPTVTATAATTAASSRQENAEMELSYPESRRVDQVD